MKHNESTCILPLSIEERMRLYCLTSVKDRGTTTSTDESERKNDLVWNDLTNECDTSNYSW